LTGVKQKRRRFLLRNIILYTDIRIHTEGGKEGWYPLWRKLILYEKRYVSPIIVTVVGRAG